MSDVLDRKEFIAGYLVEVEEHLLLHNSPFRGLPEVKATTAL